ncbi:iron-sulfur protein [Streptomyces longisporoflavus]|uniref:Rieske (2Fe-2S) protein n=1 Tax=Streptomyces longisporoflavus TaxID=28044 RepID=UPI00167CC6F6|nr:Rieske (2Fe-2S) protein [Streptomyces longisporoflavus]GGV55815.1 iron-sulfur protein [Streptomyces longisporoflavus]
MTISKEHLPAPSRRSVVTAAGVVSLAAALAACGGSEDGDGYGSDPAAEQKPDSADNTDDTEEAGGGAGGAVLAKTSEIPVGGGKIFKDAGVVVTQPTEGEFKAFSNRCTHKQCPVTSVEGGTINCPCHGSKFAVADGSVQASPAAKPLPPAEITVDGDSIRLA